MNPARVVLAPWEYEWAANVGIRRYTANWEKGDAAHYERERMEDDRTAQVAAAVGEIAVARWTNRYWSGTVWPATHHREHRNLPDVGRNIEVKRVRRKGGSAAVRSRDLGKGLVLWVAYPHPPEFRTVDLYGWLPYDEAWEFGTPANYGPAGTTRLIHPDRLLPPSQTRRKP